MKKSLSAILAAALLILSLSVGMVGTVSAAADGVLLDNCDSAPDGVFTGGWNQGGASMSVSGSDAVDGLGCYNLVNVYNCYVQAGRTFVAPIETGFSNDNAAVSFWLYVDDVTKLANSSTVYLGLQNGGTPWDGEATYGAINFELKDLGFTSGKWHKIVLPISAGVNNGWFSANSIAAYNVYSGDATGSGVVLKLDDLRMVPYAEGDATGIVQTVDLGTNVNPWTPEFPDEPFVITDGSAVPDGDIVTWPGSGTPSMKVNPDSDRNAGPCLNAIAYYGAYIRGGVNYRTAVDTGYISGYSAISMWVYSPEDGKAFDIYLYDDTVAVGDLWAFPANGVNSFNGTGIKTGWNKVVLPITCSADLSKFRGFALAASGAVDMAIDEMEIIPFVQGDASGVIEAGVQIKVPDLIPTVIDGCEYGAGPAVEGNSAWDISVTNGQLTNYFQRFDTVIDSGFSSKNAANGALSFWVYVSNKAAMVNATACYMDISSDGEFNGLGVLEFANIPWADMTDGKWNKVVLPLSSGTAISGYDYTKIAGWRIVTIAGGDSTVKIDDIRTVAYAAGDATGVVETQEVVYPTVVVDPMDHHVGKGQVEGLGCYDLSTPAGGMGIHAVDIGGSINNPYTVADGALSFWMYIEDKAQLEGMATSYLELNSTTAFDGTGALSFSIPWDQMTDGAWNKVVLPLDTAANTGFNGTVAGWRVVIWLPATDVVAKIDNMTIVHDEGANGVVGTWTPADGFPAGTATSLGSKIRTGAAYAKEGQQALCFGTQIDRVVEDGVAYVTIAGQKFELKSFGTLVMVASKVADINELVVGEAMPAAAIDIKGVNVWESTDDYIIYTGVLINIDEEHFDTDIMARSYMVVSDGVNDYTVYGDAISRSVNYTLANAA